jgi:nucleoid DNA-binding protein
MTIKKYDISKKISVKLKIPMNSSSALVHKLLSLIIEETSSLKTVKLSKFGTFKKKLTPERTGRNPKTKESYIIKKRYKLGFKASNEIKEVLN